jgi:hypothetical protein
VLALSVQELAQRREKSVQAQKIPRLWRAAGWGDARIDNIKNIPIIGQLLDCTVNCDSAHVTNPSPTSGTPNQIIYNFKSSR